MSELAAILKKLDELSAKVDSMQVAQKEWYNTEECIEYLGLSPTRGKRQLAQLRTEHFKFCTNTKPIRYDGNEVRKLRKKFENGTVQRPN